MDAHRLSVALLIGIAGLLATFGPTYAAGNSIRPTASDWQQHDTAVYVVSTLNLLGHARNHTVQQMFQHLNITRIVVYADNDQANLYFIELKRDDSSTAGILAYQLGWTKPKRISWSAGKAIPSVNSGIAQAYRTDSKTLIGTFTSTLP